MSRQRAKLLVELTKTEEYSLMSVDKNSEISLHTVERESSPLPAEVGNPEFVSLYEHVMLNFDEPIEEHDYSMSSSASRDIVSYKYDAVLQDINLNDLGAPNTPLNIYSPKVMTSIQKPSPLALTPASIEPLFSVVTNDLSDSIDNTPVPSPYCDFSESSQSLNATLVPTSCYKETEDRTLTPEIGTSAQERLPDSHMDNGLTKNTDSVSAISTPCNSISSPVTFNDSDYSAVSTPKNTKRRSKKRTDVGLKRLKHENEWIARKRKRFCNTGLEYTTSKGKTKAARSIKVSCVNCRLQCYNKISHEVRVDLFDKFWSTGDHAKQWEIIAKYVIQKSKKTATNVESVSSRRSHTLHYHLPINSDNGITLQAAKMFKMKISHHFMEKGHTQNEGDSVHALIEKTSRGRQVYSPDEWYSLVRWAKVNGNPYIVIEVNQTMIFDFKSNISKKNWTKNINNDKIMWNKIKKIEVSPDNYGLLIR